jgi:hypothetical protein
MRFIHTKWRIERSEIYFLIKLEHLQYFISASIGEIIYQSIPENNSVDSIKHSISSFVNSILYIFSSSFLNYLNNFLIISNSDLTSLISQPSEFFLTPGSYECNVFHFVNNMSLSHEVCFILYSVSFRVQSSISLIILLW